MLTVDGAVVGYGDAIAVADVSLRVDRGEAVAIIGSNGAGKTTLLHGVCGLRPLRAGTVALDGAPLHGVAAHDIARRGVAFVPAARHLFGGMTVAENLALGAYPQRVDAERLALVLELFPRLGERAPQRAGTLSGGEQQMLAVGRALMAHPQLLVLDEPTTGLAPVIAEQTYASLQALRGEGLTVLLAEQHVALALGFADRAYVMEDGRVQREGAADALAVDPAVRRAYLGSA